MRRSSGPWLLTIVALSAALTAAYAEAPQKSVEGNKYYLYTKALGMTAAGVVAVPSRYRWSVETSRSGVDDQGNDLSDNRILLRLYDPDQNFTALTAQMDLETAEKLQRELAHIVAMKRNDPAFQHRPQLYDSSLIPSGRLKGINKNGEAMIELVPQGAE